MNKKKILVRVDLLVRLYNQASYCSEQFNSSNFVDRHMMGPKFKESKELLSDVLFPKQSNENKTKEIREYIKEIKRQEPKARS